MKQYRPNWRVGDERIATSTRHELGVKNGETEIDNAYATETHFKVFGERKSCFLLEVRHPNMALRIAAAWNEHIEEDLKAYQYLSLKYSIDKSTGEPDLINWKDVKSFMEESIAAITRTLHTDHSSLAAVVSQTMGPSLVSQDRFETLMQGELDYLLFPFGKDFFTEDTLREVEMVINPFDPIEGEKVTQTTLSWLEDTDGPGGRCVFHNDVQVNVYGFTQPIDSAGSRDSNRPLQQGVYSITNTMEITLDEGTGWPMNVVRRDQVSSSDLEGDRSDSIHITVVLQ